MLLKDSNLKYAAGILALLVVICFKMSVFGFELLFAVLLLLALDGSFGVPGRKKGKVKVFIFGIPSERLL